MTRERNPEFTRQAHWNKRTTNEHRKLGEKNPTKFWAQMAKASMDALEAGASDTEFHETKIATGRYYMARHLPATKLHLSRITTGAEPVMALDAANF